MNKQEAHALLSASKNGLLVPLHKINEALWTTGDLTIHRPAELEVTAAKEFPYYAEQRKAA